MERLHVSIARRDLRNRRHVRLFTPVLTYQLPSGGVWFASMQWHGLTHVALGRLAEMPDGAGWETFWGLFSEWVPTATDWPEGWREALEVGPVERE
jgi:hypothetical protein